METSSPYSEKIDTTPSGRRITSLKRGPFSPFWDAFSLVFIASALAATQSLSRAEQQLQRLTRASRVRAACNRAVDRGADEAELLRLACEAMAEVGDYPLVWIGCVQSANGTGFRPIARAGRAQEKFDLSPPALDEGRGLNSPLADLHLGKPRVCNRLLSDPQFEPWREWMTARDLQSLATFPLIADRSVFGRLTVCSNEPDAFCEAEIQLLAETTHDIARGVAFVRARQASREAEEALRKAQADHRRVARAMTLGELAASIAHEISQPLSAIIVNADVSLRWLAAPQMNLQEARAAVQRIVRDGKRGTEVIARMRSHLANSHPTREVLNINTVIEELLPLVQGEFEKRGIEFERELNDGVPAVLMDRVEIQQVLMNLVVNGLDAMSAVNDRPRVLRIRTERVSPESLLVAVQDCGVGLSPEQAEQIFNPFYTTKADGFGMGLAISRTIVESHGGRLQAKPNNGPGATFQFTLPIGASPEPREITRNSTNAWSAREFVTASRVAEIL
jgi:C4-dicarboxylate-specific signal transduction histidine kinase